MKCPHCEESFGLISSEMKELGKSKACPKCGKGVSMGLRRGRFLLGFAAVAAPAIVLGLNGPIAAGIAGGVGALVGMGLVPTKA